MHFSYNIFPSLFLPLFIKLRLFGLIYLIFRTIYQHAEQRKLLGTQPKNCSLQSPTPNVIFFLLVYMEDG